jgi:hypothetical protein
MFLIILLIIISILILFFNKKENFITSNKNSCTDCNFRSELSCLACSNCGYYINNLGAGECIVGDVNGPYFNNNNILWETNNISIDRPYTSYYQYDIPNYRHYYGNNQGRRINHRNNF